MPEGKAEGDWKADLQLNCLQKPGEVDRGDERE
jgi:hypothetical protein